MYPLFNLIFFIVAVITQANFHNDYTEPINIGETVILKCYVLYAQLHTSAWRRRDLPIFETFILNPFIRNPYKYSIIGDHEKGEYFLKINDIQEEDLQSYFCETDTKNGIVEKQITLILGSTTVTAYRSTKLVTEIENKVYSSESELSSTFGFTSANEKDSEFLTVYSSDSELSSSVGFTSANEKESEFLSGLTFDEKLVLFGMVGACVVLVLVLSMVCNICISRKYKTAIIRLQREPVEQQRNNEHQQQSTTEVFSYDYIDEKDLMAYTDPVPNEVSRDEDSSVTSERSYFEHGDHIVDIHTYQSMKEINKNDTTHDYMKVKTQPVSPFFILSTNNRRNSLGTINNHHSIIETRSEKRANSWPNEFKPICKKGVAEEELCLKNGKDLLVDLKSENHTSVRFCMETCTSFPITISEETTTNTVSTPDEVVKLPKFRVKINSLENEVKTVSSSIQDTNDSISCSIDNLTERVGKNIDNPSYFSTISSSFCLNELGNSSVLDSKDVSTKHPH